ncbi:MAG: winged helix-turn-helix domain-containing protein [Planctomycetota bacterium]|nr:winged helix-turn-helix domain-containing protein [Planctomycetota bacterium]
MEPAGPRILVISSHAQALVQSVEALQLGLEDPHVRAAPSLESGRDEIQAEAPDVVFLLAPREGLDDSLAFCRWLRTHPPARETALVLVYPSRDVEDWKRLYEAEGDVFIVWDSGFVDGLASCVKSLVGRRYRLVIPPLKAGPLQLFPEGLLARIGGRLVSFTPMEFRVVRHLVENADRVVSTAELVLVIEENRRTQRAIGPPVLHQCISQIRKKLRPDDAIIRNVRGVGYCIDLAYQPEPEP